VRLKALLEHFVVAGDGNGLHFMNLLPNALHLTLQAKYPHCSGYQFVLKQLGFTATYRERRCLLISRSTFISMLGAGLLQPHGSESGTRHSRDHIRRHACADVSPCPMHCASITNPEQSILSWVLCPTRCQAQYPFRESHTCRSKNYQKQDYQEKKNQHKPS
jgi:hypothetical protein